MNENEVPLEIRDIIASVWRDQGIWSETANRLKADLSRWRTRAAIAGVLGALLETLAAGLKGVPAPWGCLSPWIALLGAAILVLLPLVQRTKISKDRVREWVRARSASEALKEMLYRFLVGAQPFGPQPNAEDLVKRCQTIKDKVGDLYIHTAIIEPAPKERPFVLTIADYVKKRVDDQIDHYYLPKGRQNALAAKRLHGLEFWLGCVAVLLGVLSSASQQYGLPDFSMVGPWVGVITTAGGAVTAHLAASRYDHNAIIYIGTANRLSSLRNAWFVNPDRSEPLIAARFVDECEHAISAENESWLAEWSREEAKTEA